MSKLQRNILKVLLIAPDRPISLGTIANHCDVNRSTIYRNLRKLSESGIIILKRPYPGVPYTIQVDREKVRQYVELP
jgi:predicted transcriptional regulator